ncbi:MAG: hypothetical protein HQK53_10685 [Oligoflexia bacterium]|nr:hypothetical protein [Oligoflexia bacterium]
MSLKIFFQFSIFAMIILMVMAYSVAGISIPTHPDWMERMSHDIGQLSLNQVVMPGTHDSGTYGINESSPICTADITKWAKLGAPVVARFARTQRVDYGRQLYAGIRYLDIRLCKQGRNIYTSHGMVSYPIFEQLELIRAFVLAYPKEIIILHFQHTYGFSEKDKSDIQNMVKHLFSRQLADRNDFSPTSVVNDFWSADKNVIAIFHERYWGDISNKESIFWSNNSTITNPWPNQIEVANAMNELDKNLEERDMLKLFVLQAVLTPPEDNKTWWAKNFTSSNENIALQMNTAIISKFKNHGWKNEKLNIVMYDFADNEELITSIIHQNSLSK